MFVGSLIIGLPDAPVTLVTLIDRTIDTTISAKGRTQAENIVQRVSA
jgi:hypothetical protein